MERDTTLGLSMKRVESSDDRIPVVLSQKARNLGTYIIGTTGTGKSTLLRRIARQDLGAHEEGVCVIDPHGDLIEELLSEIPIARSTKKERWRQDLVWFAPGDPDQIARPIGLNILDCNREDPTEVRMVTSTVISTLRRLFSFSWGPRMEDLLRASIRTLMYTPDTTLLDLQLLLSNPEKREAYVSNVRGKDPILQQFWDVQFASYTARQQVEIVGSSLNKIGRFLVDPMMLNIVAQPKNSFDISELMEHGGLLLVNLSKGSLGEDNAALLGAVLVNWILIAALRRRNIKPEDRRQFHLIVDEFQNFATESFAILQSEARKYAIDITVAHQYRDQLNRTSLGATLNTGNHIYFRVSGRDSYELASSFNNKPDAPVFGYRQHYDRSKTRPSRQGSRGPQPMVDEFNARGGKQIFYAKAVTWNEYFGEHWVRKDASGLPDLDAGVEEIIEEHPIHEQYLEPRRPFNDVQAEKANELSTLANYQAEARLIDEKGKLIEDRIWMEIPELWDEGLYKWPPDHCRKKHNDEKTSYGIPVEEVQAYIQERIGGEWIFDEIEIPLYTEEDIDVDDINGG